MKDIESGTEEAGLDAVPTLSATEWRLLFESFLICKTGVMVISTSQSFHEDTKERMERGKGGTHPRLRQDQPAEPRLHYSHRGLCPGEKCLPHQGRKARASSSLPQGRRELVPIGMENKDIQASELWATKVTGEKSFGDLGGRADQPDRSNLNGC